MAVGPGESFEPARHVAKSDELAGRIIAITGAGDGIGKAVALACVRYGAQVILIGRTVRKLEVVHAESERIRPDAVSIAPLDLEKAVASNYDELAAAIETRYGRLDGLLHNAALLGTLTPIEHQDVQTWMRVMHVNVTAPFILTQTLLPALRRSADASILFTTSTVGRKARAYWGAYAVSKFAVEGLSQLLADELERPPQIRVNALNPGRTRTMMRRQAYPAENIETLPLPEEKVAAYLALLGPAGRSVTGRSFDCDISDSISGSVSGRK